MCFGRHFLRPFFTVGRPAGQSKRVTVASVHKGKVVLVSKSLTPPSGQNKNERSYLMTFHPEKKCRVPIAQEVNLIAGQQRLVLFENYNRIRDVQYDTFIYSLCEIKLSGKGIYFFLPDLFKSLSLAFRLAHTSCRSHWIISHQKKVIERRVHQNKPILMTIYLINRLPNQYIYKASLVRVEKRATPK